MVRGRLLTSVLLVAVACGRPPHAPPEHSKIAVAEFTVAPNASIEDFSGDPATLGMSLAQAIAEEIRDDDKLDAQAIPKAGPVDGDFIVRGEITHVWGGSTAARLLVGMGAGSAGLGVQGSVTRRDGTLVAVFSEEEIGGGTGWLTAWGEEAAVRKTTDDVGHTVGEMIREGKYHGGHPGADGYLADGFLGPVNVAEHSSDGAPIDHSPAERLRALDGLRAQGLVSDAEYAEKRKHILQEF